MEAKAYNWSAGTATALIALPILYLLSIGPVLFVAHRFPGSLNGEVATGLDHFYYPLVLLRDTPFKDALEWYVELWLPALPGKP